MTTQKEVTEAKIEGRLSYYDGKTDDDNPYPGEFARFTAWLAGFYEAEHEESERYERDSRGD